MSAGMSDDDFELDDAASTIRTASKHSTAKKRPPASSRSTNGGSRKKPREESYECVSTPPAKTGRSRRVVSNRRYREPSYEVGSSSDKDFVAKPVRKPSKPAKRSLRSSTQSRIKSAASKRTLLLPSNETEAGQENSNVVRYSHLSSTVELAVEQGKAEKCTQLLSRAELSKRELTDQISRKLQEGVTSFFLGNVDVSQLDMYDVDFAIDIAVAEAPDSLPTRVTEGSTTVNIFEFDRSPARRFVRDHTITVFRPIKSNIEPEPVTSCCILTDIDRPPTTNVILSLSDNCLTREQEPSTGGWDAPYAGGWDIPYEEKQFSMEMPPASREDQDQSHATQKRGRSEIINKPSTGRARTPTSPRKRDRRRSRDHDTRSQGPTPLQDRLDVRNLGQAGEAKWYRDKDASKDRGETNLQYYPQTAIKRQTNGDRKPVEIYHPATRNRSRS